MSRYKRVQVVSISLVIPLLICSSATAATNWGTKGVSDTSKVSNIVQLTTGTDTGLSYFLGSVYPSGNKGNVQPWSKDGKWITFTAEIGGTGEGSHEVCKITPNGTSFTRLTTNSVKDSNASFSTDSKVYYNLYTLNAVLPNYRDRVWRMNEDGSGQTDLSAAHSVLDSVSERSVIVSPDGLKIAYYTSSNVLMVADSDGTSPLQVSGTYNGGATDIGVQEGQYSWSPDSQWLAYAGSDSDGIWIYKVEADGTSHSQLTTRGGDLASIYHYWPSWSPDGNKIAYLWQQYTSNIVVPNYKTYYELRTITAADGTALKALDTANNTVTTGWNRILTPVSWSPDSTWLAYGKHYYGGSPDYKSIFIVNTEETGGAPAQLTTGYNDYFPFWAPNGSQIAFQSEYMNVSREDDCASGCTDRGDILLLNLTNNYGSSIPFPWPMVMPAIQKKNGQ